MYEKIHWNIYVFKNLKIEKVPESTFSHQDMVEIWKSHLIKYQVTENNRSIEDYIKALYGMRDYVSQNVTISSDVSNILKNLIVAVFLKLRDNIISSVEGAEYDTSSYIGEILEAIKYCSGRQYASLSMVYTVLYKKERRFDSFVSLIGNEIAIVKNNTFEKLVTPGDREQNVHTLNYWKYIIKHEIRFEIDYEAKLGILDKDVFYNEPVRILKAFYGNFTVEYVIKELVAIVNEKKKAFDNVRSVPNE